MTKIISGFKQLTGVHCGSTALLNVANYYGHNLSEAMCFGLGSGIWFLYQRNDKLSPSVFFIGRCYSLESSFFRNLGLELRWHKSNLFPWVEMSAWIDRDVPVIILTDLYYLNYYHTNTHFGGHSVTLVGYDSERKIAFLVDTERKGLQETSLSSLQKAMSSKKIPFPLENPWVAVEYFSLGDLKSAITTALRVNCKRMLMPKRDNEGILGLKKFAAEMMLWKNFKDFTWCARYAYQVIEKRGTGGSGYRKLYADFIAEAEKYRPELAGLGAHEKMIEISLNWTSLANVLKSMSENGPAELKDAACLVRDISIQEEEFFRAIDSIFE